MGVYWLGAAFRFCCLHCGMAVYRTFQYICPPGCEPEIYAAGRSHRCIYHSDRDTEHERPRAGPVRDAHCDLSADYRLCDRTSGDVRSGQTAAGMEENNRHGRLHCGNYHF